MPSETVHWVGPWQKSCNVQMLFFPTNITKIGNFHLVLPHLAPLQICQGICTYCHASYTVQWWPNNDDLPTDCVLCPYLVWAPACPYMVGLAGSDNMVSPRHSTDAPPPGVTPPSTSGGQETFYPCTVWSVAISLGLRFWDLFSQDLVSTCPQAQLTSSQTRCV